MNKIEIMSPVGSYESLMTAAQGGADAVYFGIGKLNMRSRSSKNFTLDDLSEIAKICRQKKIRTYITLNTIVYNHEIEEVKCVIDAAKENKIDAIIASDVSVIQYARQKEMEVHISTQVNITNIEAVKFYAAFADVMVTARELSLQQVAEITRQIKEQNITGPSGELIKIEVFAHGALCMAISGKCYLSLDNENYSANRGACLQICRRPYKVTDLDGKTELIVDNEYIMSPKDLKTIDFLDKIIDAGVRILKIEGRGRSPEYVKTVSKCYRQAADAILSGTFTKDKLTNWNKQLESVYNRGFWGGYYLGRKMGEWSERYGSQATKKKIYVGKVTNYFSKLKVAEITVETNSFSVEDEILILGPTTGVYEDIISEIRIDLNNITQAKKGDVCSIPVKTLVRRGDKLYRVDLVEERF